MAKQVDKSILIGDLVQIDPGIIAILMSAGMHCVGCPSARMESVEEAALVHGIEQELLITRVNAFVDSQTEQNA